ncbi:hypothetical protein HID58_006951 [Brassica napus]|uniref:F-box domain-containing protein n=1 Tax=Brassica napus TaxID=3708 RepID=A0ABQ8EFT3_BRANA|nr:hypothetical protein HID58_006951 [Brassica napus]
MNLSGGDVRSPSEMVEEILSKLLVTCMRSVRLTCKKWNSLSKTRSFVEKYIAEETSREFSVVMVMNKDVCMMGVNLTGTHGNKFDLSIERKGKLIMRYNNLYIESVVKPRVFHSDGLLLFV